MRIKADYIICVYERIYESLSTVQKQEIIVIMKLQTQDSLDTKPEFPQGNNGKPGCVQSMEKAVRKLSENHLPVSLSQAAITLVPCFPWPLPPAL